MKILSIRLKNIHSLKGTHEISFTNGVLAGTGLFAITGPTGAGKSTLLDAITLALYNQMPRSGSLSKSGIEKTGSVINRGTDEAFAEVEYEAGGRVYRSHWEISRARTGNLRDYNMTLSQQQTNKFIPLDIRRSEVPANNAAIIGLNYDQFVKSILLSQGEFARFLKSDPKERSELLEKITGTEIYRSIGMAAFERMKTEKQRLEQIRDQMQGITLLTPQEIIELKKEKQSLTEKAEQKKQQLDQLGEAIYRNEQLITLRNQLQKLTAGHEHLQQQEQDMLPAIKKLELHHKLLPHKSSIDRIEYLHKQNEKQEAESERNRLLAKQLEDENDGLQQQLAAQHKKTEGLINRLEELKPVFTKVKNTDAALNLMHQKKQQQELITANLRKEQENLLRDLAKEKSAYSKISEKLEKIAAYMQQHPGFDRLESLLPTVEEQHLRMQEGLQDIQKRIRQRHPELTADLSKAHTASEIKTVFDARLRQLENEVQTSGAQVDDPIAAIAEAQSTLGVLDRQERQQSELVRLSEAWKKISLEKNKLIPVFEKQQEELSANRTGSKEIDRRLQIAEKYLEELMLRRERQKLEAGFDEARRNLQSGEPCPLCGSKLHPFVTHYENPLGETEKVIKQKTTELRQLRKEKEEINALTARLETSIDNNRERLQVLDKELTDQQDLFAEAAGDRTSAKIDAGDVLRKDLEENQRQQEIQKQLLNRLEKLRVTLEKRQTLSDMQERAAQLVNLENKITPALQAFAADFPEAASTAALLDELRKHRNFYKQAIEQQAEFSRKEAAAKSGIAEKQRHLKKLEADALNEQQRLQDIDADFGNLQQTRQEMFGSKDPDAEQERLQTEIGQSEKQAAFIEQQLGKNKVRLENLEEQLKKSQGLIDEFKNESGHLSVKLKPVLENLNLDSPHDALSALLEEEQAAAIQQKKEQLDENLRQNRQSHREVNEQIRDLEAKTDSSRDIDTLKKEKQETDKALGEIQQQNGTISERLNQDALNRQAAGRLKQEIDNQQKESDRWERLSELIGDAKGNKFSRFAQQLTLSHMLVHANRHLAGLTDRYRLVYEKNDNVDELFVEDRYMGNEKRSVKTLSGGESFLVSLSLSLGLSDLAGKKTRISSLFIDEGFGSLDQQTLDVALGALEKLQYETNRTIGVISHVEALKERITTQIELVRDAAGNSHLRFHS